MLATTFNDSEFIALRFHEKRNSESWFSEENFNKILLAASKIYKKFYKPPIFGYIYPDGMKFFVNANVSDSELGIIVSQGAIITKELLIIDRRPTFYNTQSVETCMDFCVHDTQTICAQQLKNAAQKFDNENQIDWVGSEELSMDNVISEYKSGAFLINNDIFFDIRKAKECLSS
jgi:hypothetical protein